MQLYRIVIIYPGSTHRRHRRRRRAAIFHNGTYSVYAIWEFGAR